jgi:hypothetical protein
MTSAELRLAERQDEYFEQNAIRKRKQKLRKIMVFCLFQKKFSFYDSFFIFFHQSHIHPTDFIPIFNGRA